jgi:glutaredoxin-related protein
MDNHGSVHNAVRKILDPRRLSAAAAQHASAFHSEVVTAVEQAVQSNAVVVVGMAQNPFVKKTRKALEEAGVKFTYLEYGSYFSKWKERLAVKLWSGWPTFPQVYVHGVLVGGYDLTQKALADGTLKSKLTAATAPDATPTPVQA